MHELLKFVKILNNAGIMNRVGNMNGIRIINNVGKSDYVKLEKVVWIVGK